MAFCVDRAEVHRHPGIRNAAGTRVLNASEYFGGKVASQTPTDAFSVLFGYQLLEALEIHTNA